MQFISKLLIVIALFDAFASGFPSEIPLDALEWPDEVDSSLKRIPNPYQSALEMKNECSCETDSSLFFQNHRKRRSPQFFAEGGQGKGGTNLNVQGQTQLWQSGNGRHQLFGQGGYAQHLGGPSGNSKPNFNAGLSYKFRF